MISSGGALALAFFLMFGSSRKEGMSAFILGGLGTIILGLFLFGCRPSSNYESAKEFRVTCCKAFIVHGMRPTLFRESPPMLYLSRIGIPKLVIKPFYFLIVSSALWRGGLVSFLVLSPALSSFTSIDFIYKAKTRSE